MIDLSGCDLSEGLKVSREELIAESISIMNVSDISRLKSGSELTVKLTVDFVIFDEDIEIIKKILLSKIEGDFRE